LGNWMWILNLNLNVLYQLRRLPFYSLFQIHVNIVWCRGNPSESKKLGAQSTDKIDKWHFWIYDLRSWCLWLDESISMKKRNSTLFNKICSHLGLFFDWSSTWGIAARIWTKIGHNEQTNWKKQNKTKSNSVMNTMEVLLSLISLCLFDKS
jgi:hypothetical protein